MQGAAHGQSQRTSHSIPVVDDFRHYSCLPPNFTINSSSSCLTQMINNLCCDEMQSNSEML